MKLDNTPAAAKIDIPITEMSTVTFTQGLLQHIMTLAGSTTVRAGRIRDEFQITIGETRIKGKNEEEAYRSLFYILLTKPYKMSAEEYASYAGEFFDMEEKETKNLIEELTKDGMSDFGQKVQTYRLERGAKISKVLSEIEAETGRIPLSISTLQDEIQRKTGYDDLDAQEILVAVVDYSKMKEAV